MAASVYIFFLTHLVRAAVASNRYVSDVIKYLFHQKKPHRIVQKSGHIMNLIQDCSEQYPGSRFHILNTEDKGRCATFELLDEDHTLGNALRHMILKNPDVKFCGYALPHPNERKINIQVQVYKGEALDALEKGLKDLIALNCVVRDRIIKAAEEFGHVELDDSEDEDDERIKKLIEQRK